MNRGSAEQYQSAYMADYGFESVMVHYRRKLLLERLEKKHPKVIVEIGCGSELLYNEWINQGGKADCWVIVEPASQFADVARKSNLPNIHVVCDFFEDALDDIRQVLPKSPDMVICSCLLHEVPSSQRLIDAICVIMGEESVVHLNVPNAESLHRRLAKSMGIISDTKAMSNRNINHFQHRVYDMSALKADLSAAHLIVEEEGGYLIKPFTHSQMEKVTPVVGSSVLDGLYLLGKEMPNLASEIFVEARLSC